MNYSYETMNTKTMLEFRDYIEANIDTKNNHVFLDGGILAVSVEFEPLRSNLTPFDPEYIEVVKSAREIIISAIEEAKGKKESYMESTLITNALLKPHYEKLGKLWNEFSVDKDLPKDLPALNVVIGHKSEHNNLIDLMVKNIKLELEQA